MKDTGDLGGELAMAADLDAFLAKNSENFDSVRVSELLGRMIKDRKLSKAAIARRSGMSEVYLHQILSGRRNPSREKLLCLAIGLSASLGETQELLKKCRLAELYPKNRRDSVVMFGIMNGMSLTSVNDRLFSCGEETLS